ncbi:MAG: DUF58 domain-containing protein [Phycisphaerae bacterium]
MSKRAKRKSKPAAAMPPAPRFRITRAGWLFLVVAVLVGLAAVKSQAPMMYVAFGGMVAVLQLSAIMSMGMLRGLDLSRKAPDRVWQGQSVPIAYFLRNNRRRSCLALTVEEVQSPPAKRGPGGKSGPAAGNGAIHSANGYCTHLPGSTVFRAGARFVAMRRGRLRLGAVQVTTRFPFGLVLAHRRFIRDSSLVVWPAPGRLKRHLLHHGAAESSNAAPSRDAGGQDEFFGLREYRSDDNPRWIHWRRSAGAISKNGAPVVREMARPLPEILWLLVDTRVRDPDDPAARRKLERVLRFAATLVDRAIARGYQVGLALAYSSGPVAIGASAGSAHRAVLLDALADVDANAAHSLNDTLAVLRPALLRQAQVALLAPDAANLKDLRATRLRASCRHLMVLTEDRLDAIFIDSPLFQESGEAVSAAAPEEDQNPDARPGDQDARATDDPHAAPVGGPTCL